MFRIIITVTGGERNDIPWRRVTVSRRHGIGGLVLIAKAQPVEVLPFEIYIRGSGAPRFNPSETSTWSPRLAAWLPLLGAVYQFA